MGYLKRWIGRQNRIDTVGQVDAMLMMPLPMLANNAQNQGIHQIGSSMAFPIGNERHRSCIVAHNDHGPVQYRAKVTGGQ